VSTMIVEGRAITAAMVERVEARMREKPFTSTMLTAVAEDICEVEFGTRDAGMRLADRLIQKHRKAGNITKSTGQGRPKWTWSLAPATETSGA
jgi:hypothetical protein